MCFSRNVMQVMCGSGSVKSFNIKTVHKGHTGCSGSHIENK